MDARKLKSTIGLIVFTTIATFFCFSYPEFRFDNAYWYLSSGRMPLRYLGNILPLFTSMFLHISILHLLSNMFCLFIAGQILEPILGSLRFLIFYLIFGLGASAFCLIPLSVTSIGASGATFGLMAFGLLYFYLNHNHFMFSYFLRWLVPNIIISFLPGISLFGHLGGAVTGLLVCFASYIVNKKILKK